MIKKLYLNIKVKNNLLQEIEDCIIEAKNLKNENYKKEDWFKEIIKIAKEFNIDLDNTSNIDYERKFSQTIVPYSEETDDDEISKEEKINEIYELSNKGIIKFVKFILKNYPYKGYQKLNDQEIENKFCDSDSVKFLAQEYNTGRKNPKPYTLTMVEIFNEICMILNKFYEDMK